MECQHQYLNRTSPHRMCQPFHLTHNYRLGDTLLEDSNIGAWLAMASERKSWSILFLLLSHGVWTTLQFVAVSDSEEQLALSSFEVVEPNEYFARHIRGGNGHFLPGQGEDVIQACSLRLIYALRKACNGRGYHDPSVSYGSGASEMSSVTKEESGNPEKRRTLVDECCKVGCPEKTLLKYCKPGNSPMRLPTSPPTTEAPPQPRVVVTPAPEPDAYNPFIHLLQFLSRHLQPKAPPRVGTNRQVAKETLLERNPSEPQARTQKGKNGPSMSVTNYGVYDNRDNNLIASKPASGRVGFGAAVQTNQPHDNSRNNPHPRNPQKSRDQLESNNFSNNVFTIPDPQWVIPNLKKARQLNLHY